MAKWEEITDGTGQTIMVLGGGELVSPWVQGGGSTVRGARATLVDGQPSYFDALTGFGSKGLSEPGVQVLFADGSVRVISGKVDSKVFRAMCTIHGSDSVDLTTVPVVSGAAPAAP
jgi:prepilin-type processing-associated H-X9-DG protein